MAVGLDGLPVITWSSPASGQSTGLAIKHCADLDLTSGPITYLEEGIRVDQFSAVAIGSDGLPFVVYS